jgi:6-phosphogluconate dehydrogenase
MQLGMVGLGRMGANMARRLQRSGHEVVALDLDVNKIAELEKEGMKGASSIPTFVGLLKKPRVVWLMVPSGEATESMVNKFGGVFEPGDILIDGGNSYFKDDVRRAAALKEKGIHYCDVGTSGGVWGLERGYCLMAGAEPEIFAYIEPILKTLAPGQGEIEPTRGRSVQGRTAHLGYLHCGPAGSGHFVKMVHNGIEYGLMQAYAEGFELLEAAEVVEDVPGVIKSWTHGTVIRSWLLDLLVLALEADPKLAEIRGYVEDSGEGRWTIEEAINHAVPAPVMTAALYARFASRQDDSPAMKAVAALRNQFGGHAVTKVAKGEVENPA